MTGIIMGVTSLFIHIGVIIMIVVSSAWALSAALVAITIAVPILLAILVYNIYNATKIDGIEDYYLGGRDE